MRYALLGAVLLFISGSSVALANISYDPSSPATPQPFAFYCGPYETPFVSGGYYTPTENGTCTFDVPAVDGAQTDLALYKGVPGNASLIENDVDTAPVNIVRTFTNTFGGSQGDDYFAVLYGFNSFDDVIAANSYLESGTPLPDGITVDNILQWKWGVAPAPPTSPLTVTANNQTSVYGSALPPLTATLSGFVAPDTASSSDVTGAASCTTTATSASAPGIYPITCTIGTLVSASKYTFDTFVPGTLTITKAPLTVTANNQTSVYGSALPPLTATLSGFVNGDAATSSDVTGGATCSTAASKTSPVGTYPITCSVGTLLSSSHYTFNTFVPATLTITQAPLTVTANSAAMTYGGFIQMLTAMLSGFVNNDTATTSITGTASCITTAINSSPVGAYPIVCSVGTLASQNYSFATFFPGLFTINKAPLTVTADNKTMVAGSAVPALTATISGFVGGQTLGTSGVSGGALCSAPVTSASAAGNYPITCTAGTLVSANYSFNIFTAGTLTVTAPPDHTPPVIIITNPLKDGLYAKTDSVLVTATVTDQSAIASTTYWFGNTKINPLQPLPLSSVTTPSIQTVSVSARDIYGNVATSTVKFFVVKSTNSCLLDIVSVVTLLVQDKTFPDKVTIDQLISDCSALLKNKHRYDQ